VPQWVQSNRVLTGLGVLFLIILITIAISLTLPSDELMIPANAQDIFETSLGISARRSMGSFLWWYRSNIVLQFTLIAASLLATVTAALTTSENANVLKKYSIVFTAVTATLATAQQTFHIRENINSFISSTASLELLVYDYVLQRARLSKEGRSEGSPELLELQKQITQKYTDIEADRMRAWASIGDQTAKGDGRASGESGAGAPGHEGGPRR
jgi:hypothetical protein